MQEGKYFSSFECVQITRQTLSGLAYIHGLDPQITHRDVTDTTIFVEHRDHKTITVKLGDFGVSKEGPKLKTVIGTPYFYPPKFFDETGQM